MKKTFTMFCFLWGTVCWAQLPTSPNTDSDYGWGAPKWVDNFNSSQPSPQTKTKVGNSSYIGSGSNYYWNVVDSFDHGGEPQVYLDDNSTIDHDPDASAPQTDKYLVLKAKKKDFNCITCKEHNHHYTSGEVGFREITGSHDIPQFGYIEAKIKISNTFGTWAAFWGFSDAQMGYFGGVGGNIYGSTYSTPLLASQTSGTTNNLNAACFTHLNNGFIVGDGGKIIKTADGTTWSAQTSGTTNNLNAVCFTNINTGYAVGAGGTIIGTINNGANWNTETSGTTNDLNGVCFPGANNGYTTVTTGYAVGNGGKILKTTDGGWTWVAQSNPDPNLYNLKSVFFTDADHGFIVGEHGVILKNVNASATGTWVLQTNPDPHSYNLNSVYFSDINTGYAVGDNGIILKFTSALSLNTINVLTSGTSNNLKCVSIGGGSIYAVGANSGGVTIGTVLKSVDAGTTWNIITNSPTANNIPTTNINFAYCFDDYDEMDFFEMDAGGIENNPTSQYYQVMRTNNHLTSNVWTGAAQSQDAASTVGGTSSIPDFSVWHTYGIEWSPSKVVYYIDGQIYKNVTNPGFQISTGTGGMITQKTNIVINLAMAGYNSWYDNIDWPGKGGTFPDHTSVPAGVTNTSGQYDPYYSTTGGYKNYSDYFVSNVIAANAFPTTLGPEFPAYPVYPGYDAHHSFNNTDTTTYYYPYMLIDHVSYYQLDMSQCSSGTLTYNTQATFDGYNKKVYQTISIQGNSGVNIIDNNSTSSSPKVLRASQYVEIAPTNTGASFEVPLGSELFIDITPCY